MLKESLALLLALAACVGTASGASEPPLAPPVMGKSTGTPNPYSFADLYNLTVGAQHGLVSGTYIHGCFASDSFRSAYLKSLGADSSDLAFESLVEKTLDELAAHLEQHLDLDQMLELAGEI